MHVLNRFCKTKTGNINKNLRFQFHSKVLFNSIIVCAYA